MSTLNPCTIHGDRRDGVLNYAWHNDNPSSAELAQALLRLDAKQYTMVTIAADEDKFDSEECWDPVCPESGGGTLPSRARHAFSTSGGARAEVLRSRSQVMAGRFHRAFGSWAVAAVLLAACGDDPDVADAAVVARVDATVPVDAAPPDANVAMSCYEATRGSTVVFAGDHGDFNEFYRSGVAFGGYVYVVEWLVGWPYPGSYYDRIVRIPTTGGRPEEMIRLRYQVISIAVDEHRLYWTTRFEGKDRLFAIPLSGGPPETLWSAESAYPTVRAFAFDGDDILLSIAGIQKDSGLYRLSQRGGELERLSTGILADELLVDGDDVYGASRTEVVRMSTVGDQDVTITREGRKIHHLAKVPGGVAWLEAGGIDGTGQLRRASRSGAAAILLDESTLGAGYSVYQDQTTILATNDTLFLTSTLWRADMTTGSLNEIASFEQSCGQLVEDDAYYYFSRGGSSFPGLEAPSEIRAYPKAGGDLVLLAQDQWSTIAMVLDDDYLYWANAGTPPDYLDGQIVKLAKSGGVPVVLADGLLEPYTVVRAGDDLYFNSWREGTVHRVSVNGGPITTIHSGSRPYHVAVGGDALFWTEFEEGTVMRYQLPDGPLTVFAEGQAYPTSIKVHGDYVYWHNDTTMGDYTDSIMRAPLEGGTPEQLCERLDSTSIGVDDEYAYAVDFFDSRLYAVPLDGSAVPTVLERDLLMRDYYRGRLVSDGSTLYYATSRGIWRRPPDRRAELVAPVQVRSLALDGDLLVWVTDDTVACLPLSAL